MSDGLPTTAGGIHLRRGEERTAEVDAVDQALVAAGGGRVGLDAVLSDLNREATVVRVPAPAARWGFRWNDGDVATNEWWPQGITTSADRDSSEEYAGQRVVFASWYSSGAGGTKKGSRISVVSLSGPSRLRYRHVLLVEAVVGPDGKVDLEPLQVHAGGLVWHRDHLYVAGTARGIATCRLDDVMRVGDLGDPAVLGLGRGSFGYRYLLPVRFTYDGGADPVDQPFRYSFLSLGRRSGLRLVAGEYGRGRRTTRLAEFDIDPATGLLRSSADGAVRPVSLSSGGVQGMQGATVVDGRWYVTASAGRYLRGSLYVGRPGSLRRRALALPIGVEDITHWPSRDELWTLSEYPGRRFVAAMSRGHFG